MWFSSNLNLETYTTTKGYSEIEKKNTLNATEIIQSPNIKSKKNTPRPCIRGREIRNLIKSL